MSRDPFQSVRTYEDLLKVNVRFLQGRIHSTPYQLAPVDAETVPLLGNLTDINRRGFFSFEGQPTMRSDLEIKRGYIIGFVPTRTFDAFLSRFLRQDVAYKVEVPDGDGTLMFHNFADFTKPNVVTWEKRNGRWVSYTAIMNESTRDAELSAYDEYPAIKNILSRDCVMMSLIQSSETSPTVESVLQDCLPPLPPPARRG
jgi:hypothetical protein